MQNRVVVGNGDKGRGPVVGLLTLNGGVVYFL